MMVNIPRVLIIEAIDRLDMAYCMTFDQNLATRFAQVRDKLKGAIQWSDDDYVLIEPIKRTPFWLRLFGRPANKCWTGH